MLCPFVYLGHSVGKRNNWKKARKEVVEKTARQTPPSGTLLLSFLLMKFQRSQKTPPSRLQTSSLIQLAINL